MNKSSLSKPLDAETQRDYWKRLHAPRKNGAPSFFDMIREGDGQELSANIKTNPLEPCHFMSRRSSARVAFDVFSALDGVVDKLSLEKKLSPISGSTKGPNMDAFYQIRDMVVFVESKYTEDFNAAYLVGYGDTLKRAYYSDNAAKFYGDAAVARLFCRFCLDINEAFEGLANDPGGYKWFNAKQQTTHLFGIIGWLLGWGMQEEAKCGVRGKHICLLTTIWQMANDTIDLCSLPGFFKEKAEKLVNDIIEAKGLGCTFYYLISPIQSLELPGVGSIMKLHPFEYLGDMRQLLQQYQVANKLNR